MKIVISENQYNRLIEDEEQQKVLRIPSLKIFSGDWDLLQKFLELKGNPPYSIGGDLDLRLTDIESLGNLKSVGGYLDLRHTDIESLGNLKSVGGYLDLEGSPIESLGNLQSVGGDFSLRHTEIESLGNLKSVDGNVFLRETPLSKIYTEEQIRKVVDVGGVIFM
jgi:hypothetical protein